MVGLPGSGLGGVFYILLVFWMVVRECWLLVRSASHPSRWRKIASLGLLATAIVSALWLEGWLLSWLFVQPSIAAVFAAITGSALNVGIAVKSLTPMLTLTPFVILAALFTGVHAARHVLVRRKILAERLGVPSVTALPPVL